MRFTVPNLKGRFFRHTWSLHGVPLGFILLFGLTFFRTHEIQAQVQIEFPVHKSKKDSIPNQDYKLSDSARIPQRSNDTLDQEPFYYVLQGDSLVREYIDLNEVVLLKRLSFKDISERRKYIILRRRTLKFILMPN